MNGASFPDKSHDVYVEVNELLFQLEALLKNSYSGNYDKTYDSMVGFGELISTTIIHHYLSEKGIENKWVDARNVIKTSDSYRQAEVDWKITENRKSCVKPKTSTIQRFKF